MRMAQRTTPNRTTPKTADAMALDILLAGGPRMQARLTALHAYVERQHTGGACPACGAAGPHDDNGCSGDELSFCCCACGEQWDAVGA